MIKNLILFPFRLIYSILYIVIIYFSNLNDKSIFYTLKQGFQEMNNLQ